MKATTRIIEPKPFEHERLLLASLVEHSNDAIRSELCRHNSESLLVALRFLHEKGIKAFRILSPLFPRFTHPGYATVLSLVERIVL